MAHRQLAGTDRDVDISLEAPACTGPPFGAAAGQVPRGSRSEGLAPAAECRGDVSSSLNRLQERLGKLESDGKVGPLGRCQGGVGEAEEPGAGVPRAAPHVSS